MKNKIDEKILRELLSQNESETLEFKRNNSNPENTGKYISALANSSAIFNQQLSFIIWGISDEKEIVGTDFYPESAKYNGGEPFISWLERMLDPRIVIDFENLTIEGKHLVVLIIHMTARRPVAFKGSRYIRSGSAVKNLAEYPEKERNLWRSFDICPFKQEFVRTDCYLKNTLALLEMQDCLMISKYSANSDSKENS